MQQFTTIDDVQTMLDLVFRYELMAPGGQFASFTESDIISISRHYYHRSYKGEAFQTLKNGLTQYPSSAIIHAEQARLLLLRGWTNQALEQIEKAASFGFSLVNVALIKAQIFSKQKKYRSAYQALNQLKDSIKLDKEQFIKVVIQEAKLLEKEGEAEEAFAVLSNIVYKHPLHEQASAALLTLVDNEKLHRESLLLHLEITNNSPFSHLAWYNLGQAQYALMDYEKAIESFEYSYLIKKDFVVGYIQCAEVCMHLLRFRQGLICYRDVLEFVEPNATILFNIAQCYDGLDSNDEAIKYYIRALEIDDKNEDIYYHLGKCYQKSYKLKAAAGFLLKAWQLDPQREDIVEALATTYFRMGRHSKVAPLLNKVIELNPVEDHGWVTYAKFLILTGQFDEASTLITAAEEHTYSGRLLFCKAAIHCAKKEDKETFDVLGEALENAYESVGLFFELVPHIRHSEKVKAILNYYDPEYYI